ncbi:MAG: T9SS type A sorting domain-containing protein, partial [Chitinophagales bacterium]
MPYISGTSMTQETGVGKNDGSATVEVTGGTPPYTVEWPNDVEGTIDASGGSDTLDDLAQGNYEVLVTDDNGMTAKACIYVSRKTGGGTGRGRGRSGKTADITELNTLIAQPNPFTHSTTIAFNLPEEDFVTLNVYSLSGKLMETIYQGETEAGQNYQVELNASSWASGVYILNMTSENGFVAHKRLLITK